MSAADKQSPAEEKAADEAVAPAAAMNTSNDRVTPESAQTDLTGKDKTAMDSGETSTGKRARDLEDAGTPKIYDSDQESDAAGPVSPNTRLAVLASFEDSPSTDKKKSKQPVDSHDTT